MLTTKELLESGVHFGHQSWRANPKMLKFILKRKIGIFGIDILDIVQTLQQVEHSCAFLADASRQEKKILFVGTKIQASHLVEQVALKTKSHYINQKWLGGFLTNWSSSYQGILALKEAEKSITNPSLSKSEKARLRKKITKLMKCFAGVQNLTSIPDIVIIVGQTKEKVAVDECRKLKIPLITLVDTNCDPDLTDFAIPANDDSTESIKLILAQFEAVIRINHPHLSIKELS